MVYFLDLLSVFLNSSVWEEPFQKVNAFICLHHFFSIGFVLRLATLFEHFLMVDDIFKDVDVSSLKFFVFYHASGEENI